MEGNDGAEIE